MRRISLEIKRTLLLPPQRYAADASQETAQPNLTVDGPRRSLKRDFLLRSRLGIVRELWSWIRCKQAVLPSVQTLNESLKVLNAAATNDLLADSDTESPVFLLASGWRTGSTLLQRVLVTDPRIMLWGEPFGEMAVTSTIVETVNRICGFPGIEDLYAKDQLPPESMASSWIGTLYPHGHDFRMALRSFFDRWLGQPARERGFTRWGFKEVRLGATEATLLHWLYPRAKFLLLSRHPYDCYKSLADSGWHHVYHRRPDVRVDSAAGFGKHWNRLATSWAELPADFPAYRIKYEDLIARKTDFRELESWLGLEIKEDSALSVFVSKTAKRARLNWYERFILDREVSPGMRALGYLKGSS